MHRGLVLASFLLASSAAAQQNTYRYAYLSHVEGEVSLQRASESEPESGALNVPLQAGDRIWTRSSSRAEIRIGSGLVVHLSEGAKLDIVANDSDTILRLWSGSAILKVSEPPDELRLDTPAGSVRPAREGSYRIDVEGGDAVTLSVERGSAELASSQGTVLVQSGETSYASPTEAPSIPVQFNTARIDDFDRWSDSRVARQTRTEEIVVQSLPREVRTYAYDLVDYGDWYREPDYGYVWYPRVEVGWSPYTYGRWGYTHWGHTWISHEPWGWAPYHYGRWGFGHRGWYWIPGSVWGPAWVSFAIGPTWIGWSPLGFYGGPVFGFHAYYGGYNHGYYGRGGHYRGGWNVCSRDDFRRGVVTRGGYRRLEPDAVRATATSARFVNEPSSLDRELNPRVARARSGGAAAGRSGTEEALRGFRERSGAVSSRVLDATPRTATPRVDRSNVVSDTFRQRRETLDDSRTRDARVREPRGEVERSRPADPRERVREILDREPRGTVDRSRGLETRERLTGTTPSERAEPVETRGSDRFDRIRERARPIVAPPDRSETRSMSPGPGSRSSTRTAPSGRAEPLETRGSDRFDRVRERSAPLFTPREPSETRSMSPRTGSRGTRSRPLEASPSSRFRERVGRSPDTPSLRSGAPSIEAPSQRMSNVGEGRSSRERSFAVGSTRSSRSSSGSSMGSGSSRGSQPSRGGPSGSRGSAQPRGNRR
jgi:hypothetical protein